MKATHTWSFRGGSTTEFFCWMEGSDLCSPSAYSLSFPVISENSKNCEGHKCFWSFGFPSGPLIRRTSIFEASQKAKEEWKLGEKLGTSSPSQPLPIWRPAWDLIVYCLFVELSWDNMATGRLDDIENIFNSRGINKGTVWLKLPSKLIKGTWLTLEIV